MTEDILKNVPLQETIIIRATVWYVARHALLDYINNQWDGKTPLGNYIDELAKAEAELDTVIKKLLKL